MDGNKTSEKVHFKGKLLITVFVVKVGVHIEMEDWKKYNHDLV